jgi:hypothetical protein
MPLSPEDFYAHVLQAADGQGRLPLSRMTGWETFRSPPPTAAGPSQKGA